MKRQNITEKQKKWAASTVAVLILAALGVSTWLLWEPLTRLTKEPEIFRAWIDRHYFSGRLIFFAVTVFQVIAAFIPGEPLEIFAGYAFGAIEGAALSLGGCVLGSVIVFLFVRRFGIRLVTLFFPEEKLHALKFLQTNPRRQLLFFCIFTIPGTPKDLLCYFAGLTDMPLPVWLLICSVGRIPSIVSSTVGGDALGVQDYTFAIAVFAITLAVSAAGLGIYHAICRHAAKRRKTEKK